jgi:hypothetical protein
MAASEMLFRENFPEFANDMAADCSAGQVPKLPDVVTLLSAPPLPPSNLFCSVPPPDDHNSAMTSGRDGRLSLPMMRALDHHPGAANASFTSAVNLQIQLLHTLSE